MHTVRRHRTPGLPAAVLTVLIGLSSCASRQSAPPVSSGSGPAAPSGAAPSAASVDGPKTPIPTPEPGPTVPDTTPAPFGAEFRQGVAALDRGEMEQARTHFEAVPASSGGYRLALHNLALINEQRGDFERAVEYLRTILELNPKDADAHADLGWMLYRKGDCAASVEESTAALESNGRHFIAAYNVALCKAVLGQYDDALNMYRSAMEVDATQQGLRDAVLDLDRYLEANSYNASALFVMAMMQGWLGNLGMKRAFLQGCLDASPTEALQEQVVEQLGEVQEALAEKERQEEEQGGHPKGGPDGSRTPGPSPTPWGKKD